MKERRGAVLHKLIKTFSYADEADKKFAHLERMVFDTAHYADVARQECADEIKELRKDLDDLRAFVVNRCGIDGDDEPKPKKNKDNSIAKLLAEATAARKKIEQKVAQGSVDLILKELQEPKKNKVLNKDNFLGLSPKTVKNSLYDKQGRSHPIPLYVDAKKKTGSKPKAT